MTINVLKHSKTNIHTRARPYLKTRIKLNFIPVFLMALFLIVLKFTIFTLAFCIPFIPH